MTAPVRHAYLSTACWHAQNDNRPELHAGCRNSCKHALEGTTEPCICPCHGEAGTQPGQAGGVDQARDAFTRLLAITERCGVDLRVEDPDLFEVLRDDPDWFWARGEVQPAGEWQPTNTTEGNEHA